MRVALVFASLVAAGCTCSEPFVHLDAGTPDAPRFDAPAIDALGDATAMDAPDAATAPDASESDATVPADVLDPADAPSTDVPLFPDAPIATDAPVGADAPTANDAGARDAPSPIRVSVRDLAVYGNCFPTPPDPVIVFWTLDVSGASRPTATLVSATLTLIGPRVLTQSILVDAPTVTLIGGAGTGDMRKLTGMPSTLDACGEMCSGTRFQLELAFEVDGMTFPITVTDDYSCVF